MPAHDPSASGARASSDSHSGSSTRQALSDSVYEAIKAKVMDHEISPGARVSIEAVARALDVSPTPVREALSRLEADGLVVKRSLSGYRATELLTRRGVEELFEMRLLLEPRAAALAALNADDAQLDAVEALLEEMQSHPETAGPYVSYREFAALDQRFHDLVARAADRPLLADAVERLHSHLHIFRLNAVQSAGASTVVEHERVVRALLRRRSERAAEAMADHLNLSLERQRRSLGE